MSKRNGLMAIFLLGLLMRLPFALTGFHASLDVETYIHWGTTSQSQGLTAIYQDRTVDYPPVLLYLFSGAVWLQDYFGPGNAVAQNGSNSGLAIILIQFTAVLADLLTAALLARIFWRDSQHVALLVAALWLFNPVVWYESEIWCQTDSIFALLLLASVFALSRRAIPWAWLLFAVALTTKLQSVALLPLLLGWTLSRHGIRGLVTGIAIAGAYCAAICAPWLIAGRFDDIIRIFTTPPEARVVTSAYNAWYLLLSGNLNVSSDLRPSPLPLTYMEVGNVLFIALAMLVVGLLLWRGASLAVASAALCLAMFLVLTQMHERHSFASLVFLIWASGEQMLTAKTALSSGSGSFRRLSLLSIYGLLTMSILYNLITIIPPTAATPTSILTAPIGSRRWAILVVVSFLSALTNLVLFGWILKHLWRGAPPVVPFAQLISHRGNSG